MIRLEIFCNGRVYFDCTAGILALAGAVKPRATILLPIGKPTFTLAEKLDTQRFNDLIQRNLVSAVAMPATETIQFRKTASRRQQRSRPVAHRQLIAWDGSAIER